MNISNNSRWTNALTLALLTASLLVMGSAISGCSDPGTNQNNPAPEDARDDTSEADTASDTSDSSSQDTGVADTQEDTADATDTVEDISGDTTDTVDTSDTVEDTDTGCANCGGGDVRWSALYGTTERDVVEQVSQDSDGNVYVTGRVGNADIDFGSGPLAAAGDFDIFVAKFDQDGNHLWSRRFGNSGLDSGTSIVATSSGQVYLAAYGSGGIDFGSGSTVGDGNKNIYLVKFDDTGDNLWSLAFARPSGAITDMSVAADSDLVVAGNFNDSIDLGGGALDGGEATLGHSAMLLARFDADGTHLWSRAMDGDGAESAIGVATDGSGGVDVAGYFDRRVDMGGGDLTSDYGGTAIAKYDLNGDHVRSWALSAQGGYVEGTTMDTDIQDNVYIAGTFDTSSDFGGQTVTNRDGADGFLAKYDSQGTLAWVEVLGQTGSDSVFDIAVTDSGVTYAVGYFDSDFVAGTETLTSAGENDAFVTKLDTSGTVMWASSFGGADRDRARAVAVDEAGHLFIGGATDGTLTIDGQQHQSAGSNDLLFWSLTP